MTHPLFYAILQEYRKELMPELLTILRDWSDEYGGRTVKTLTLPALLLIRDQLDMDNIQFSEFMTGFNCDSYADRTEEIVQHIIEYGRCTSAAEIYDTAMGDDEFKTLYTVYRLWNPHHTTAVALDHWRDSCLCTIENQLSLMPAGL